MRLFTQVRVGSRARTALVACAALALAVTGCQSRQTGQEAPSRKTEPTSAQSAPTGNGPPRTITVQRSDFVLSGETAEPQLTVSSDRAVLSWIESSSEHDLPGKAALKY